MTETVVCVGAGPAGLTAGYLLCKEGRNVIILEADSEYVGGISRTVRYKDFHFDIGGHRFFSKSEEIERLWDEILDDNFLERPRKSRIYYKSKLFDYPLRAMDAFSKLGPTEAVLCVLSYMKASLFPNKKPKNFQEWVINKFGERLFRTFFKTYTEKVWGMPCSQISADWAAQRIKGLSLLQAIWHSIVPQRTATPRGKVIKTLVSTFRYPRRGPGMLWESAARKIQAMGGEILLGHRVVSVQRGLGHGDWTVTARTANGDVRTIKCEHVISSMPMRHMVSALQPAPPAQVHDAAASLKYRDFLTVALIIKDRAQFDDNWIYIHEPGVKVGRIQNFKSWSPDMVPTPGLNCYGMEYFCFEGDQLWASSDGDLIELATAELLKLGLADESCVVDGAVVRQPKAYPVYNETYDASVNTIRRELDASYPGLHLVGRNGMHKYNNQDHAMMTAMLTVRNIVAGRQLYDVWRVNQDAEYHEEAVTQQQATARPKVPQLGGLAGVARE